MKPPRWHDGSGCAWAGFLCLALCALCSGPLLFPGVVAWGFADAERATGQGLGWGLALAGAGLGLCFVLVGASIYVGVRAYVDGQAQLRALSGPPSQWAMPEPGPARVIVQGQYKEIQ